MCKMILKEREVPFELRLLRSLHTRMDLTEKDQQYLANLEKGYEGEKRFDEIVNRFNLECIVLNDLLLQVSNQTFQIDSLVIADKIYMYEIKNYAGDFYYDNDRLYNRSSFEISNPLNQLARSESLLRQLLQSFRLNTPIDSSVIFINPEFTLYQAPLDKPFIYPTQLNRYLKHFSPNFRLTNKHKALAEKLISLHIKESPYSQVPKYEYEQLVKGIVCRGCRGFVEKIIGYSVVCQKCEETELVKDAVLRSTKEFSLLFPNKKITTEGIFDWSGRHIKKPRIKKILEKHYTLVSKNRWSYFKV